MNMTVLVIAALATGALQVEAAYPMAGPMECERVAAHAALADSYPGRIFLCLDGVKKVEPGGGRSGRHHGAHSETEKKDAMCTP